MRRSFLLAFLLAGLLALPLGAQTPLITQPITGQNLVALPGSVKPLARRATDLGPAADSLMLDHMLLRLRRSPARQKALAAYLQGLQTPGSPDYHQWLTAAQFQQRFGPAPEDVMAVESWLAAQGFLVNGLDSGGLAIDFSGSAGQVRSAFHTQIHRLLWHGQRHIGNLTPPQIPAALAPAVAGIVSLSDFRPQPLVQRRAAYTLANGALQAVVPADLATIYDLHPLFEFGATGRGQTIAVLEPSDMYSPDDWTAFRSAFGLSGYGGTLTTVHPEAGPWQDCADPGAIPVADLETTIDAEWAGAAAPGAHIEVAACADTQTTFGAVIAMENLLAQSRPPEAMSLSYGACEAELGAAGNAMYRGLYRQAEAEGVSMFVAAGDWGAATCDANSTAATHGIAVNGLASTPDDVAVGGTDFGDTYAGANASYWSADNGPTYGSALSYVPEVPWDDSCANSLISNYVTGSPNASGANGFCNTPFGEQFLLVVAGGGGPSACALGPRGAQAKAPCRGYRKPWWQAGTFGNPNDGVRDLPDVSLFAANGVWGHYYVSCYSDPAGGGVPCTGPPSGWVGAGGTSFAAPIMAGIQAVINGLVGGRQGNPNPVYYALADAQFGRNGDPVCNASLGNAIGAHCVFHDVTLGDIAVNCTGTDDCYLPSGTNGVLSTSDSVFSPAYSATPGWDFASGIGSVDALHLALAWPGAGPGRYRGGHGR